MTLYCLMNATSVSSPFPLPDSLTAGLKRRCIRPCRVTPGSYKARATVAVTSGGPHRTVSASAATEVEAEAASQGLGNVKNLRYSRGRRAAAAQDHNQK